MLRLNTAASGIQRSKVRPEILAALRAEPHIVAACDLRQPGNHLAEIKPGVPESGVEFRMPAL